MSVPGSDLRNPPSEITATELITYAHRRLDAAGVAMSPSKVSRVIRRIVRETDAADVQAAVDRFLAESWTTGGDPYFAIALPYADPTGNTAARNIDNPEAA